jgi:hypothetical protein
MFSVSRVRRRILRSLGEGGSLGGEETFALNPSAIRSSHRLSPPRARSPHRPRLTNHSIFAIRPSSRTPVFSNLHTLFAREKRPTRLFSIYCALFRARRKDQLPNYQKLTHSLFRSCAQERKLNHAVSIACALFREKRRGAPKFGLVMGRQGSGLFPESGRME